MFGKQGEQLHAAKIAGAAWKMGLTVSDGSGYYHKKGERNNFIRLGFASLSPAELEEAVSLLVKAVKKSTG